MDSEKIVYYGGLDNNPKNLTRLPELGEVLTVEKIEIHEDDVYMVTLKEIKWSGGEVKFDLDCFVSKKLWDTAGVAVKHLLNYERRSTMSTFLERHPKCICWISLDEDKKAGKCSYCSGSL